MEWLRLVSATIRSGRSANTLYRLAAVGEVRTRQGSSGRLEFAGEDLNRLREGATKSRKAAAKSPSAA